MNSRFSTLFPKSTFLRNIGVLAGGTALAQLLMALSLPLLTRLYTPQDFSYLAVYMSILSLATVVSCLRLNIAIPLPENEKDAINLVALSLAAAVIFSLILAVPVVISPVWTSRILHQPDMVEYLWMVPIGVLLASVYTVFQYWSSRCKRFSLIARTQITRTIGGSGTQVGIGLAYPAPFGLIFGHMMSGGLGIFGLARALWQNDRALLGAVTLPAMQANFSSYRRFPIYSVPESLFNAGGTQIPILIVAAYALGPEAGFLMLAIRVMGLPMGLLGQSVSQVYLVEAPQKLREASLASFTRRITLTLLKIGGPPLVLGGLVAPFAVPFIFGPDWTRAGVMIAWMTPWFILQFISSPISVILHVTGSLFTAMILQLFGLVLRVGSVILAAIWARDYIVEIFSLSSAIFYAVYMYLILRIVRLSGGIHI